MTRWQVYCAVALRRLPELMPKRDPIELKVQQIFNAYEAAKSRYSQHEMQHEEELKLKNNSDSEVIIKETAQDRLDKWMKNKSEFKFADYNDRLSQTHYLFVNTRFGTDIKDQWLLPQATFMRELGDQDLMDTARRALKEQLGIINGFTIVSRIPSSHYKFRYPRKVVDSIGFDGAAVFYLKANLDRPSKAVRDAIDSDKNVNMKWLTRSEARSVVSKEYMAGFQLGLLHEDRVDIRKVLKQAAVYAESSKRLSAKSM